MKRRKKPAIVFFLRLLGWLFVLGTLAFLGIFAVAFPQILIHIQNSGSAYAPAYTLGAAGGGIMVGVLGVLLGMALLAVASVIMHLNDIKRLLAYQARALGSM